jgi:ribosome-associated translation inhibitor RaiA
MALSNTVIVICLCPSFFEGRGGARPLANTCFNSIPIDTSNYIFFVLSRESEFDPDFDPNSVMDSPPLRNHIEAILEELETLLPDESPLTISVKRVSKRLFGADIRARVFGRQLVVHTQDTDLLHALTRARRHLIRQIEEVRSERRYKLRHGRRQARLGFLPTGS